MDLDDELNEVIAFTVTNACLCLLFITIFVVLRLCKVRTRATVQDDCDIAIVRRRFFKPKRLSMNTSIQQNLLDEEEPDLLTGINARTCKC